jgi:hypothetical protein
MVFAGRFLLAFGILLVPATLMGVTLPPSPAPSSTGWTRSAAAPGALRVNTLGAVVGCALAGLARRCSGCTSRRSRRPHAAVGAGALALAGRFARAGRAGAQRRTALRPSAARRARLRRLGFAAMGYEVLWSRALIHFTHNSTTPVGDAGTFLTGSASAARWLAVRTGCGSLLGLVAVQLAIGAA